MFAWLQGFKQNIRAPGGKLWNLGVWNNWSIYHRDWHMVLLPKKFYENLKKWHHLTAYEHYVWILSLMVLFLESGSVLAICEINEKKFIFHWIGVGMGSMWHSLQKQVLFFSDCIILSSSLGQKDFDIK